LAESIDWEDWPFSLQISRLYAAGRKQEATGVLDMKERKRNMRKDALTGWFVLALAMGWLGLVPGRAASQ
jgi:hypothetical protein